MRSSRDRYSRLGTARPVPVEGERTRVRGDVELEERRGGIEARRRPRRGVDLREPGSIEVVRAEGAAEADLQGRRRVDADTEVAGVERQVGIPAPGRDGDLGAARVHRRVHRTETSGAREGED